MAALKINTTIAICRLFKEVEDALQLILEGCCVQFSHHLFFFLRSNKDIIDDEWDS